MGPAIDFTSLLMLEVGVDATDTFVACARRIQRQLWADMEHREYDGVSLLREITRRNGRPGPHMMPVVFTSAVNLVDDSIRRGEPDTVGLPQPGYAISQTSQAWLDCQLWEQGGDLLLAWDPIHVTLRSWRRLPGVCSSAFARSAAPRCGSIRIPVKRL